MPRQLWIADASRAAGLKTVEVDGWRERGSATLNLRGLVAHHTAGASSGDMPSLRILIHGRSDLPGPLCQVGLGRSGTVYVVASGRANHAGKGGWRGLSGNTSVLGIEAENDGRQRWTDTQLDAYYRLSAVLAKGAGFGPEMICGHKEWAPSRKPDPHSLNMNGFRSQVAAVMRGTPEPKPAPIEEVDMFMFKPKSKPHYYLTDLTTTIHIHHIDSATSYGAGTGQKLVVLDDTTAKRILDSSKVIGERAF